MGGPYEEFGRLLAREASTRSDRVRLQPVPTAASVENLQRIASGRADLGLTLADMAATAVAGEAPFDRRIALAALARVYVNFTHVVVPDDSDVRRLTELTGRRVAIGAAGSGTEVVARRLLRVAGLTARRAPRAVRLDLQQSVDALRGGHVDALFWSGGIPTRALVRLAAARALRLLDLGEYVDGLRTAYGDAYTPVVIPAGAYGLGAGVATIGVANYLVADPDLPADEVREVTRVLFTASETLTQAVGVGPRLEPRFAISTGPVPLHEGAAAYYRFVYG
jgi:TRAP transporter TAXI family solute receptor